MDYTNPLTEKSKWNGRSGVSIRNVDNKMILYTTQALPPYNPLPVVNNYNLAWQSIYSVYNLYQPDEEFWLSIRDWGWKFWLPGPCLIKDSRLTSNSRWAFSPVFSRVKMKNDQGIALNYTRKINRPNFFQLYPYTIIPIHWTSAGVIRTWNLNSLNSVELSHQKIFKRIGQLPRFFVL